MNPRADSRTVVPDDSKIMVYEREIEEKLGSICASAFQLLKTQLEEKREILITAATATQYRVSGSDYYSTEVLKKKLSENLRLSLDQPDLKDPLRHIQHELKGEYDSVLSNIDKRYEVIKESIKSNLIIVKRNANYLAQLEPPLRRQAEEFKVDLIAALQGAAVECRALFISKGKWTKAKMDEFIDIFGCVVRIFGSTAPYELDTRSGYGSRFGRQLRIDGKLPKTPCSIASMREMKLDDIEKMINRVISECNNYPDDNYVVLQIIKKHFEKLSNHEKYRGYFQFQDTGTFYRYLTSVTLPKENDIVEKPLAIAKQKYAEIEMKSDGSVAQQIQDILKPLQNAVDTYKNHVDKNLLLISSEVKNAEDSLYESSVRCHKDIDSSISSMQLTNSETKEISNSTDTETYKVQLAYENAIRDAKVMDQKEFAAQAKWADDSLSIANTRMDKLNSRLLVLETYRKGIAKKLVTAKEMFNGPIYSNLQAKYKREVAAFDALKARYVHVLKDFNQATVLPKAIIAYGEFHFDCASAKSKVTDSFQSLDTVPGTIQTLKDTFDLLFEDVKTNREFKLEHYRQKCELELAKADDALKKSAENIALANEYKLKAIVKLSKAQAEFSPQIHAEHQESFDVLEMRSLEVKKHYDSEEKNLASMRSLPDAMKDYSSIVLNTLQMQKDSIFVTRSCGQLSANVDDILHAKKEAKRLARVWVAKQSLEILAQTKLEEIEQVLGAAQKATHNAEQIMLREQKALRDAKEKYPEDIHIKPQELFDVASNHYALALTTYNAACKKHADARADVASLHEHLVLGKKVEHEKHLATDIRQFLLKTIFMNLDLWKPTSRLGGINYQYAGVQYHIGKGIHELIMGLTGSVDHTQWINKVVSVSEARDALAHSAFRGLRYRMFSIRNEKTTGELYRAIKNHLKLDNIQSLQQELMKIPGIRIPAIELEEKSPGLVTP